MTPNTSPQAQIARPCSACATPPETYRATPANVSGGFYSLPAGGAGFLYLTATPDVSAEAGRAASEPVAISGFNFPRSPARAATPPTRAARAVEGCV